MFRFIHSSDIHLDSPLRGLIRFEDAPVERIQSATREAFKNLIQLALDEKVAFLLIAGDLWDCDWLDAGPGLFFIQQAARLAKANIHVYIVKGNHDAVSRLTTEIRNWGSNVHIFDCKKPHTIELKDLDVAIHGQSYAQQHVLENLSANYPKPVTGAFNIGMLHTCVEDGSAEYSPCAIDNLVASGYDYWALGHIHQRMDMSRNNVHVSFPGNPQGRSMRETGPKGCTLVTVADDHSFTCKFEPLDVVRWQELAIAATDENVETEFRRALEIPVIQAEGRLLAVRVLITGFLKSNQELRDRLNAVAVELGNVWIETVRITRPSHSVGSAESLPRGLSLENEIQEVLASMDSDDGSEKQWIAEFSEVRARLTGDLLNGAAVDAMNDPQAFRAMVSQVAGQL